MSFPDGAAGPGRLSLRVAGIIFGIALAAAGGALAYRAFFVEPSEAVVITDAGRVRELPDLLRVGGGLALLLAGAAVAYICARRRA